MTSQHIKHHKLQKLLRPSGIVFLINITTEEKKAGIDNVSTVSTLLFKNTWMTFGHSTFKSEFGRRKSDISQATQSWSSPESLSRSPPAAASTSRSLPGPPSDGHTSAAPSTHMTPEAAVPRAPDTNSISTFTLCLPLAEKVLESIHLSWFHHPFQSIQSKHGE